MHRKRTLPPGERTERSTHARKQRHERLQARDGRRGRSRHPPTHEGPGASIVPDPHHHATNRVPDRGHQHRRPTNTARSSAAAVSITIRPPRAARRRNNAQAVLSLRAGGKASSKTSGSQGELQQTEDIPCVEMCNKRCRPSPVTAVGLLKKKTEGERGTGKRTGEREKADIGRGKLTFASLDATKAKERSTPRGASALPRARARARAPSLFTSGDRIRADALRDGDLAAKLDAGGAVLGLHDLELDAAVDLPGRVVVSRILAVLAVAPPSVGCCGDARCSGLTDSRVLLRRRLYRRGALAAWPATSMKRTGW